MDTCEVMFWRTGTQVLYCKQLALYLSAKIAHNQISSRYLRKDLQNFACFGTFGHIKSFSYYENVEKSKLSYILTHPIVQRTLYTTAGPKF